MLVKVKILRDMPKGFMTRLSSRHPEVMLYYPPLKEGTETYLPQDIAIKFRLRGWAELVDLLKKKEEVKAPKQPQKKEVKKSRAISLTDYFGGEESGE